MMLQRLSLTTFPIMFTWFAFLLVYFLIAKEGSSMSSLKFSLKQSLNVPGVKKAFQAIFDPSLVVPQMHIDHINQLNFVTLKEQGITCIIFDKDQTLSVTYVDQLHPSVLDHINQARQMFPNAVAILSNSVGSCDDDGYQGAMETEKHMKLPVIRHRLKKPCNYYVEQYHPPPPPPPLYSYNPLHTSHTLNQRVYRKCWNIFRRPVDVSLPLTRYAW